jgi:hypothetical protein
MGEVLSAFESYRLGVVSTVICPQNEWPDYRTGRASVGLPTRDAIALGYGC